MDQPTPDVEAAFTAHYRRIYPRAIRFARRFVDDAEAEDAVQTVFVRLWDRTVADPPQPLPGDEKRADALVLRSVRNELTTAHRVKKRLKHYAADIVRDAHAMARPWADPYLSTWQRELSAILTSIVDDLPRRRREVFILARYDEMPYAEIAETLGITVSTVHQHLVKANKYLRKRLLEYKITGSGDWLDEPSAFQIPMNGEPDAER